MTESDRGRFGVLMLGLGETFGEPVSDTRMEIYFRALSDFELDAIARAVDSLVRTSKFFPRPAEIREAMTGSVDDHAELAWNAMVGLVRRCGYWWNEDLQGPIPWPDDATRRAALELYGGWKALCECLPASGPEMLGTAKLFKTTFKAYAARDLAGLPAAPVVGVLTDGA
jgi:hypothetical protein